MEHRSGSIAAAGGPLAALAIAGITSTVRDSIGTTNVALALAAVVVAAAITGRAAGLLTAFVAALSFNFLHTEPYHSLRIHDAHDVITVLLLAGLGLVISELGAWRRRAHQHAERRLSGLRALETTAAMLVRGATVDEVWTAIRDLLMATLPLADCRFEATIPESVAVLPRSGSLLSTGRSAGTMSIGQHGVELPTCGVAIEVACDGERFGSIVLTPRPDSGSLVEERRLAIALADQYAVALRLRHS